MSFTIGITQGDPKGIGPEVICKALETSSLRHLPTVIFGEPTLFKSLKKKTNILILPPLKPYCDSSYASLEMGTQFCLEKKLTALVTAPVNKHQISKSEKISFNGHTGFLKSMCEKYYKRPFFPTMLFSAKNHFLSLATVHVPLSKVSQNLSAESLKNTLSNTYGALVQDFRISHPRLAILGLNPHAGENGILGHEEKNILFPLVRWAQKKKIDLVGPFSPDSFFATHWNNFHGTIALYHDQGLIPFKLKYFDEAVNVTIGLPIIRTSVDHGVGYDIAGKDMANPLSMIRAIQTAIKMVRNRKGKL